MDKKIVEVSEAMSNSEVSKDEVDSEFSKVKISQINWEFEQSIKKETRKPPLVCLTEDISKLYQQYEQDSEIYRIKIVNLAEKHSGIRRCRSDGNSFYRAFAFAWFERIMNSSNKRRCQSALNSLAATNSLLNSAGYVTLVYEDAYNIVEVQMKAILNGEHDEDMLLTIFQTDEISNYIVYYFRLITAAYLKLHQKKYEHLLEFEIGMDQFCTNFVELMDQEADNLHAIALTKALNVPVEIGYIDSDMMKYISFCKYYPDNDEISSISRPLILLHHSKHYDILYRWE
ncbi:peptidase C65 Otubain-domain-containing protein [Glomus cerebriforme]|uniref:ubiquitinyl hydrolase 1 n=1 Tax=Glomus cerebriforme TaxID=658196 RepID=A0A397T5E6_9GLOM|nr:peptidase C65 Otubain-domain-containing protein [Glomus cerebriforme]